MMLDGGKIKEIQVKLLLSSRSEMHKVIEAARQSVPILSLAAPSPVPTPVTAPPVQPPASTPPVITPFSAALGSNSMLGFGIPGIGNPQEIPQPAVIEPPAPLFSPTRSQSPEEEKEKELDKMDKKRKDERRRTRSRSRSRSRDRDRKDRKRDRRDRSRSRERRRRDRSRSRDRRDRKRDRKERSRSRDRSPSRRSRDRRNLDRKSPPQNSQERTLDGLSDGNASRSPSHYTAMAASIQAQLAALPNPTIPNGPLASANVPTRFNDPTMAEALNKLQELGKKRNPNAFQGEPQNGNKFQGGRGGGNMMRGGGNFRSRSRFDTNDQCKDCCVVIKNAQNHTSYGDVRRFFPYMIDKHGIKMINDNLGRRTGTIYVRFCDPQSKQLALQRKNNELKGANVIVESLDDSLYEAAVDSYLPYREENDTEEDSSQAKLEEDKKNTMQNYSILKMSELPNFVKEHDIIKMFSDFSLLSIILDDCRMTRSKIAYVQFVKPEDARMAFERKESYAFGRRQVTLTPLSQEEFENIKPKAEKSDGAPLDVIQSNQDNISMPRDPRQRRPQLDNGSAAPTAPLIPVEPQGPGFFQNPSFPQNMGQPFPASAPQYGAYPTPGLGDPRTAANWNTRTPFPNQANIPFQNKPPSVNNQRAVTVNMEDKPLDSVLMKGLPRDATDRTIVNFLSDTGAVPARIHLMLDGSGLPSGDCFCEFRSTQEARQAVTKHGQMLEGCRITVDLVTRGVVEEALEGPKEAKNPPGPSLLGNAPPFFEVPRFAGPGQPFRGRGGFDRGGFDRGGFRGGFDQVRGGFDKSRGGFDQGRGGFDMRGGFRGRGGWNDRGRGFDRGRGRGFGRGRGGFTNGDPRPPMPMNDQEEQDPALEDFGAPGCVVSMVNVPFRATVDDILAFFAEFELTQDDVIRRYNERGQPTGDARVAFRTPFDAQRALKTRQMNTIFDRRINLTIL
ncbi:RNA-binding protein 12 [Zerene cesonia]|uniref:RNA-binding protein 12 n=1 Tax=Zerene cesonia TaxID=33412 RepID=UPI0018E5A558|nr:RNA-binding protein 12 [Zerene cesonia]